MESSEQNGLTGKIVTDSLIQSRLLLPSGGWIGRRGLRKKEREKTHGCGQTAWWLPGEKEVQEVEEDIGKINGDGQRFYLGWWTHNTVYAWWLVVVCTWNLYNFVDKCHPNKFNKNEEYQFQCQKDLVSALNLPHSTSITLDEPLNFTKAHYIYEKDCL